MRLLGLMVLMLATLALPAHNAFGQVVVDGDLTDLAAVAQGDQSDPINEICVLSKSGFDIRWAYVYYNIAEDRLYLGMDLMDVPDPIGGGGFGLNGPGVPGDADGDLDPSTAAEPSCPVDEEQAFVGPDELYLIKIDTDADGSFDDFHDVRIAYRGNLLRIEHGDSTPIVGATGSIVLGTAGVPFDPGMPNQNRLTEDIEFSVDNWSTIDPNPTCFIMTTFSGSLVDGFPEDNLITPITVQVADPQVNLDKLVRNFTQGGAFADSASVEIGDEVEFSLTLTNIGNVDLQPVAIEDHLPEELTFIPGSVVGSGSVIVVPEPGGVLITFKSLGGSNQLPVGEDRTVTFRATVENTINDAVVNTASGGGFPPGECAAPDAVDSDDATVSVVDLECTKQVSLDNVNFFDSVNAARGQTVFFDITLTNPSSVDLTDTTLVDTLPAGFENIVAPGCAIVGQTVTCNIGVLPGLSSITVTIQADITATATGTLVNTAECSANFGAQLLVTTCEAEVVVLVPELVCDKKVSHDGVTFVDSLDATTGMEVFFRVEATNTGDAPFFEVTLEDILPAGYGSIQIVNGATCGVAGQTISCTNIGPLDPAQTATVIYKATITAANPPVSELVNTATCIGTSGTPGNPGEVVETECEATVRLLSPCVICTKEVSADGVNYVPLINATAGDHVFFRVTVTNCGDAPLTNISMTDNMPAGLSNVSTADADCGVAGNTVTCALAALAVGQSWEFHYEADIDGNAAGTITNTAFITATPTVNGNTGDDVSSDCSAQLVLAPLTIPTLSEWGLILLCSLLALSLILHHRFRLPGAF